MSPQVPPWKLRDRLTWTGLLRRVEEGDHPTPAELADLVDAALREHGVSEDARLYVGRRIRDEAHKGDGGAPARGPLQTGAVEERRRFLLAEVGRLKRRYARVRVPGTENHPPKREYRVFPRWRRRLAGSERTTIIRPTAGQSGDWIRTKQSVAPDRVLWKLRSPLTVAIRRVAVDAGEDPARLRRWWKKLPKGAR